MAAAKIVNSKAPKKSTNSTVKNFSNTVKSVSREIYDHQDKCAICQDVPENDDQTKIESFCCKRYMHYVF